MSDYLANGEECLLKMVRLRMNRTLVERYEAMESSKPTFSTLLNSLLEDWLVTEDLKAEFEKLNNG
ncbi:hypothetical protein [Pseudomonas anguilliseptica]|uniref:Uncharacterized protein n=2 Tax=Pseudomonas anguilliseptica TaxID=53406 RepID=A0A1H4Q133_PSEAG|nr:hypothetical protein [Pseudomonas anguilliseptica]SEC13218.1 hypothetical protein SAMN05421553_0378 [Pseudomonas anguilliseptica]